MVIWDDDVLWCHFVLVRMPHVLGKVLAVDSSLFLSDVLKIELNSLKIYFHKLEI